jgi:hypothetical protein
LLELYYTKELQEIRKRQQKGIGAAYLMHYLLHLLRMEKQNKIRICYEWQRSSLRKENWAKSLKEEAGKFGTSYIWQSQAKISTNWV